jgi:hypothetical protein
MAFRKACIALVVVSVAPGFVLAQPVVDPDSCHAYGAVAGNMSWEDARAAAGAMSFRGVPGHLATVTSQHETDFLLGTFGARDSYALGGVQSGGPEPAGGWTWITGEPWGYTNWAPGEPNNALIHGEEEDRLCWRTGTAPKWNDVAADINAPDYHMLGFFVEYDLACCVADWNHDGVTNSTDVSDFINDWFQDQLDGTLVTDWDGNGVVNSTDVSGFINSWFEDAGGGGCG